MRVDAYLTLALTALTLDGAFAVRSAQKSKPLRAPLSSSRQHTTTQLDGPAARTTGDNLTLEPWTQWGNTRRRGSGEPLLQEQLPQQARREHAAEGHEMSLPARAAKRKSQSVTKAAFESDSIGTESDEESSSIPSSPLWHQRKKSSASPFAGTLSDAQSQLPSSSSRFDIGSTSSGLVGQRGGVSRWSATKYSSSERKQRKRLFDSALKASKLSVHTHSPSEFLEGTRNMKIDGHVSGQSRALYAKNHVKNNAPNQDYLVGYMNEVDQWNKEYDRNYRERKKAGIVVKRRQKERAPQDSQQVGKTAHSARSDRRWARIDRTVQQLEEKGYKISRWSIDELEEKTRGVSLDDVDAATCSRHINDYIRKTRGDDVWNQFRSLKDLMSKREYFRKQRGDKTQQNAAQQ